MTSFDIFYAYILSGLFTTAASRAFCLGSMNPSKPLFSGTGIAMERAPLTGLQASI